MWTTGFETCSFNGDGAHPNHLSIKDSVFKKGNWSDHQREGQLIGASYISLVTIKNVTFIGFDARPSSSRALMLEIYHCQRATIEQVRFINLTQYTYFVKAQTITELVITDFEADAQSLENLGKQVLDVLQVKSLTIRNSVFPS